MSAQSAALAAVRFGFGVALIAMVAAFIAPGGGLPTVWRLSAAWHKGATTVPLILCSTQDADPATPRPASAVTVLQSEALHDMPRKRITTLLVRYPPRGLTPKHVHGGAVTAYVLSGHVRSQLNSGPIGVYGQGEMFYEPVGTVHTFIENPSFDEPAELLATIVHNEGAALTTFVE
jgi:quercetin dioxygenase-like cupin family protein